MTVFTANLSRVLCAYFVSLVSVYFIQEVWDRVHFYSRASL